MATCIVLCFIINVACCFGTLTGSRNIGISAVVYLEKAGDLDHGCLQNLTFNNTVTDFTFTPEDERSFLRELYHATRGRYFWSNKTGWEDNSGIHHCQWFGIECYRNSSYIKWINLINNNLVGQPPNFWRFRNLQGLCLSRNKEMTGNLQEFISPNMTRLRRLLTSFSGVYGKFPWDIIVQLRDLEKLQICCCRSLPYGAIPPDIGRLKKLQVLSLGETGIRGDLPTSISNLKELWFLDLEYVELTSGNLSYFNNMSKLEYLHLTNCGLKGTLPSDFGQRHPKLIELRLYGNNLHGKLHNCFLGFEKITQLSLGVNRLHGVLPTALSTLTTLQVLDLSKNNFTGFAETMTFSKQLQTLYIDGNVNLKVKANRLLNALQPCKLTLRMLVASKCSLHGGLDSSLWNFGSILYIDLSENNMTGKIPTNEEYTMAYLFYLALASNNFTGNLPMSFFSPLTSLTYLDMRENPVKHEKKFPLFRNYLSYTFSETLQRATYTCPTLRLKSTGGRADIDPSYYGYLLCFCNIGYYGSGKDCKLCMQGGSCKSNERPKTGRKTKPTTSALLPRQKFIDFVVIKMKIKKGYWPCCGDFDNVTRLVKCSQEEKFDEEICSPTGKCQCEVYEGVNGQLRTFCNSSCVCRYGNQGRFCSQCMDGYYKKGSICVSCPEFRKNFPVVLTVSFVVCLIGSVALLVTFIKYRKKIVLVLMFLSALTLIVLHFKSIIPGWFFVIIFAVWILGLSDIGTNAHGNNNDHGNSFVSFLCIAIFFFQSLDAMLSDAAIWPTMIVALKYQVTNAFNFEISELTCSFSNANRPEISFAIILLLPVTGLVLIWLFHGLGKVFCCRVLRIPSSSCKKLSIQILLFVYFPITAKTFGAIKPCEHRDGLSYLKNTPWLDCDGTSYNWLVALGYGSLVVFVIGVPFFVFLRLLVKNLDSEGEAISEGTDIWLKPLYEEYKKKYRRYFPLVFLARRLLLAVFLTLVPTTSSYQVISTTLLLIFFIVITLVFRPYQQYSDKFEFETMADVIVSIVLLLSFVGLALLRVSKKLDKSLVWLIISMNLLVVACCILGILVLFVVNLWKSSEDAQQQEHLQDQEGYERIPGGPANG